MEPPAILRKARTPSLQEQFVRTVILGCGYTGRRVATLLARSGHEVVATARDLSSLTPLPVQPVRFDAENERDWEQCRGLIDSNTAVFHSIPPATDGEELLRPVKSVLNQAQRVVYLSTTGVYGTQTEVDESTLAAPVTHTDHSRVRMEVVVLSCPNSIVLRSAAIYGPWRGVHRAIQQGRYPLRGRGSNFVSRIHVDDLAAHCVATLFSDVGGAWPVADEDPCTAWEIAAFCAQLLGVSVPDTGHESNAPTLSANRRVNGRAITKAMGLTLRYPSYRVGIPACIAEERAF